MDKAVVGLRKDEVDNVNGDDLANALENMKDTISEVMVDMDDTTIAAMVEKVIKYIKIRKKAKIRNRYNQVPQLTQETNGKVTNSQLYITNESQEVSLFSADDHSATIDRRAQKHNKHTTEIT